MTKSAKQTTIESRIDGRLAAHAIAGTANRELGLTNLQHLYGRRLATMVENGNTRAIKLAELINRRRTYKDAWDTSAAVNPTILESIERPIVSLSKALGLAVDDADGDVAGIMRLATSPCAFESKTHFHRDLMEGLLLNVTTLAAKVLSIPSGEYLVWTTDPGHTMLVPTSESQAKGGDLMTERPQQYDIVTTDLLGCWNKIERTLIEHVS